MGIIGTVSIRGYFVREAYVISRRTITILVSVQLQSQAVTHLSVATPMGEVPSHNF